jgi:hypothetical protein
MFGGVRPSFENPPIANLSPQTALKFEHRLIRGLLPSPQKLDNRDLTMAHYSSVHIERNFLSSSTPSYGSSPL